MKVGQGICIGIVLLCSTMVYAHDVGTHWYVGLQTLDIWQIYDPDFYNVVRLDRTDIWAVRARKFYCIGLALPDLLSQQDGIKSLTDALYDMRDEIIQPAYRSAYDIYDEIENQVQTPIEFNGETPNANLTKLREMADWVRVQVSSAEDKAVVYGALMHVIHDLYAHMMLQPARFGYGRALQYNPPVEEPLYLAESYYEILTPTHVSDWSFVSNDIYRGFCWNHTGGQLRLANPGIYTSSFWREWNSELGTLEANFQELDFAPIQRFVDAANACAYGTASLTRERLEAYIHVGGIALFAIYGYEEGNGNVGGLVAHPEWTFAQCFDFVKNIGESQWTIGGIIRLRGLMKAISVETAVSFIFKLMKLYPNQYGARIHEGPWMDVLVDVIGNNPWFTYLETTNGIDSLWAAIPDDFKDEYYDQYVNLRATVNTWNQGEIKKPNLQSSYSDEINVSLAQKDFYEQSLLQGSAYLDHTMNGRNKYKMMRKQGVWGGLHDVQDDTYYRQPSLLDMHFLHNDEPQWTEMEIPLSSPIIDLAYNLFTFGKTRLRAWGKGRAGSIPPNYWLDQIELGARDKYTGDLAFDAVDATNNCYRETSFLAETWSRANLRYWRMLDSDYRSDYTSTGPAYGQWFNNGNPLRTAPQDPINDPLHYWPYVLGIVPLKRPTVFRCIDAFASPIKLSWIDNSNLEDGFKMARRESNQQWNVEYSTVGSAAGSGSTLEFIDTVTLCHKYIYKVRAFDNYDRFSDWSDSIVHVHGSVAQANYLKMSAYNTGSQMVKHGNDVYVAYADAPWPGRAIQILHSKDNGSTFRQDYCPSSSYNSHPAIGQDSAGTPYIVWGNIEWKGNKGPGDNWYRCYKCVYYRNGMWHSPREIYSEDLNKEDSWTPEESYINAPSIAIGSDSGYVVFKSVFESDMKVITFHLSDPDQHSNESVTLNEPQTTEYISIAYDKAGRIAIAVHEAPFGPVRLYYRGTGANHTWQHMHLPGIESDIAWGSPSLWAEQNKLYVTVEGYDHGSSTEGSIYYFYLKWTKGDDTPVLDTLDSLTHNQANLIDPYMGGGHGNIHPYEGTYKIQSVETIGICDFDNADGVIGYSHLAASDVVLWWRDNDIWYSSRNATGWTAPQNLSNSSGASCYPQGATGVNALSKQLFSLWTETIDNDCYLIRTITPYGDAPPPPPSPPGGAQGNDGVIVEQFRLDNIYPNPTNRTLKIRFSSPDQRSVSIKLYDVTGRLVKDIYNSNAAVGVNEVVVESSHLSAGVYFLKFAAEDCNKVEKVILVR